jgi:hypothetical protein
MTEAEKEVGEMLGEIREELTRARTKFPGRNLTLVALMEEVGELASAVMDKPREEVFREAVQVAVMAMRVWLDGDHSVEYRRSQNGLKPLRTAET